MGLTLEEVRRWEPGTMIALGDDITAAGKQYESDVQDALVGVLKTEADWSGPAGEAARSRANRERNAASNAAATMLGLSDALTTGGSQLSAAKNRVLDAVDAATKAGCTVSPDGQISYNHPKTYPTQAAADAADAAAKAKVQKFGTELHEALQHAAQVDANVASDIESQLRKVQDEAQHPDYGSAGASAGAYASIVQSEYAQKQKAEVANALAHPGLAKQLLPHLDPTVKHAIGQSLAQQTDHTLSGPHPDLSNANVAELHRVLHAYGRDPQVASSMYEKLGAAGAVGSLRTIDALAQTNPQLAKLAPDLRDGLAAASNAPGFPAERFGRNIVKYAGPQGMELSPAEQQAFAARYPELAQSPTGGSDGASVLTYLMRDHHMNGNLVLGSANGLDGLERHDPAAAQSWYRATSPGDGALTQGATDPMAAIMGNLGAHPKQGYEFFTHPGDGVARQNYYFEQRDWGSDGYAGISSVAEHIGTDPALVAHDPTQTSRLVSRFMHDIVHNPSFDPQHPGAAASSHIAGLMKFYTPAVSAGLNTHGPELTQPLQGIPGFHNLSVYPSIRSEDLDSLFQAATSTKAGMTQVAEGIGAFNQIQMNAAAAHLRAHPGSIDALTEVKTVVQNTAALNGAAQHAIGQVAIQGAADTAAQKRVFTNLVGDAAAAVPVPGAGLASHAISTAVDFGSSHLGDIGSSAAQHQLDVEIAKANKDAGVGLEHTQVQTYLSMARAGLIPQHAVPQMWRHDGHLITPSDITKDQLDTFASSATRGIQPLGITPEDIKNAYKDEFLHYYNNGAS